MCMLNHSNAPTQHVCSSRTTTVHRTIASLVPGTTRRSFCLNDIQVATPATSSLSHTPAPSKTRTALRPSPTPDTLTLICPPPPPTRIDHAPPRHRMKKPSRSRGRNTTLTEVGTFTFPLCCFASRSGVSNAVYITMLLLLAKDVACCNIRCGCALDVRSCACWLAVPAPRAIWPIHNCRINELRLYYSADRV